MLAGVEETVYARECQVNPGSNAIQVILEGLIDYAGLYPPAGLNMRSAVANYRTYRNGKHRNVLGRFIFDASRMDELIDTAGGLMDLRLSLILSQSTHIDELPKLLGAGVPIESVECKAASPGEIEQVGQSLPPGIEAYFEIPVEPIQSDVLRAILTAGARVKLRMGGVVIQAFPSSTAVARMLAALIASDLAFKATAGLHHPIRSVHPFTYAEGSAAGFMHGFVNLLCAAALIQSGADVAEAERVLEEQEADAWSLSPQSLSWRNYVWSREDLSATRERFVSFGSCSFEEPMHDLEALGWL